MQPPSNAAVRPPPANARRRLLRGGFAAPAVLTLCSGSALAASSSLRCVATQAATPATAPVSSSTDSWVRVQLWTKGSSNNYFVKGADLVALKPPSTSTTSYLGATQWQAFDVTNNTAGAIEGPRSGMQLSSPAKYAAIRVDANGNIVGIGSTGGGTAIAGTCWLSFVIAP